jgi:hypothetical protein
MTGPHPSPSPHHSCPWEKERLFAAVTELMLQKHCRIQEAFSTVGTNVGLGRGQQPQPLTKTLLTRGHFKGLPQES